MEAARKDGELPYTVAYTNTHTLGMFLDSYVSQKIHPVVKSRLWKRIDVRGVHRRMPPAQIFPSEASDRKFNWQRPTAEIVDEYTLQIYCFPGKKILDVALRFAKYITR
jgi:hypothetical protein